MNRLHVHLHVNDLTKSVRFYSALFGTGPSKRESDYAKWMLDDPRVNFAISTGGEAGLSHLGIQVEDEGALAQATQRALSAAGTVLEEKGANCCYAVSDKAWATDPQGVRWETFRTTGDLTVYGVGAAETVTKSASTTTCCSASPVERKTVSACCGEND
ncbi:MAG TPA: ArsI/CadI family heavy metal resistance metalloenzyme [Rhizomicrobium sp.]|nr:ArsI/CadI family heavy metal resistance metalloenzyme [Rhizomicrobium sp.]